MTPKIIKSKATEKIKYRVYLKKSDEFYKTMLDAVKNQQWNSAGLNAVHCAISGCDAMTVFYAGVRSSASDHFLSVELLAQTVKLPEINEKCSALRKILADKNIIEYEDRDFSQKEALEILKLTERFHGWVLSKIG